MNEESMRHYSLMLRCLNQHTISQIVLKKGNIVSHVRKNQFLTLRTYHYISEFPKFRLIDCCFSVILFHIKMQSITFNLPNLAILISMAVILIF